MEPTTTEAASSEPYTAPAYSTRSGAAAISCAFMTAVSFTPTGDPVRLAVEANERPNMRPTPGP
ncbi:hypothetical protein GCM10018965_021200 [Nonomuraea roseola]